MKRNKIAAGALALALGLGAVAPSLADSTATPDSGKGQVLVTTEYREAETAFVKAFKTLRDEQAKLDELVKIRDEKEAAYKAARDAVKEYHNKIASFEEQEKVLDETARKTAEQFIANGGQLSSVNNWEALAKKFNEIAAYDKEDQNLNKALGITLSNQSAQVANLRDLAGILDRLNEVRAEHAAYYNLGKTLNDLQEAVDRASEAFEKASRDVKGQKDIVAVAQTAYNNARAAFLKAGADKYGIDQAERTGDVSYVTEAKESKEAKEEDKEESKDSLAVLRKAVEEAKIQKAASEYLLKNTPATVKPIESQLRALLAKQEELLEKAQKALEAKKVSVADILFSTAYAAEEEKDSEIDQLINDLNENTKAQQDLLKENEANQAEKNKEESKEEDSKEESKEEDKKEDSKEESKEDKKEDSKEESKEDKKEDKKEEKATKKASKNAKTGVAGLTGVAGILAAAAAAYATSKRD